jgi:myo-inositol 2-dehydrogenase / D-chiro-inositol 1-dehydrogenase
MPLQPRCNMTPNRRQFLFSMAPLVLPAAVLGRGGAVAPSNRVTVAMIGMGRQAVQVNVKQFFEMPGVQVVAVCDVDAWRLENAKRQVDEAYAQKAPSGSYKGCLAYKDFREVLANKGIDAVMISAPDHWHVPISMEALQAGKDVSCEKPLTRSIGEGRQLSDMVTKYQRVFRTDSEFRSLENFYRAVELVRNGRIGKLHTIKSGVPAGDVGCPPQPNMPVPPELDYERWQGPAPRAPYTEKRVHTPHSYERGGWMRHLYYCDGMITNWGAHLNDIAQWGNNTDRTGPVEVEAHGTYPAADSFWNVLLTFEAHYRYANGVHLIYKVDQPYVRFEGDEGWIYAEYGKPLQAEPASILGSVIGENEIHFPFKSDKQDFIDAVKTRGQTLEDAEVGHRTVSLCHLGHIAIQTGKRLEWDPAKEQFTNSDEANAWVNKRILNPIHA